MEQSNLNDGWDGIGLDWISLNSLTTRSPYGDNKDYKDDKDDEDDKYDEDEDEDEDKSW